IVDGELSLRFCPNYPKKNFYSTPDALLDSTQKEFYAIDLTHEKFQSIKNDPFLVKLDLGDAIADNTLAKIADTYDFQSKRLLSGYSGNGSPIITFNHQLKLNTFPMAQIVSKILDIGERTMGCSVEIEFAGNFRTTKSENDKFYILQIRPFLQQEELINEDLISYKADELVAYSTQVSGNVVQRDLHNIVYVKPATFDKTKTKEILEEIDEINSSLKEKGTPYILIGFGRWGTSNEFLGIPAKWDNISGVKVLIEASLEDFNIDFSQGSHFFQNIIHSNIGYLHIDYNKERDFIDWNWLDQQKVIREKKFVKHIRTKKPMTVKIDGKKRIGLITKEQRERKLKKL
ncbi:MAG: hypothetical protein U9O98_09875, partial [Asgard group archaeon]|nr:hypothetical protein [Asgard group archaeon]